ncbi:hypothetical protein BD311DRAFT_768413 [Dichomitus squalens]|uniref:Uncharacterized protein n=1 Tax=Dichomitus squalens TaxID=114155 RepID=A0A4Q9PSC2_9APHY|nr:hypothetical protein BD311DRAFT_768413 [Dichomitus squalens]TBU57255.1 hypothetical protein BD310DRAFT_929639 [Dichomitus squalens]
MGGEAAEPWRGFVARLLGDALWCLWSLALCVCAGVGLVSVCRVLMFPRCVSPSSPCSVPICIYPSSNTSSHVLSIRDRSCYV